MNSNPADEADDASAWRTTQLAFPDEPTRLESRAPSRPAPAADVADHALPDGTEIEGFRIVRPIGEGGFGIVYLAWDEALERKVAIKEYMPAQLATRVGATWQVAMRSERDRSTFDTGLKSFVNEARLLARFDHPALVKVLRFWEANGTAYMAMPYYEGPTLKAALERAPTPPSEVQLRDWLRSLLEALSAIHRENCYHRDIAPDNILLTDGGPLLLDFGAARRVISDRTQALTTMLKPGFAPIEQYGGVMMQGPWTDLYALAGVMHYAIAGRPPVPSVVRVISDSQPLLATTHAGRYDAGLLRAIDAALAVRPEARPQDVQAFRELLNEGLAPDSPLRLPTPKAVPLPYQAEQHAASTSPPQAQSVVEPATVEPAGEPGLPTAFEATRPDPLRTPAADPLAPRRRSPGGWVAAGLVGLAALGAGTAAWWPAGGSVEAQAPRSATASPSPAAGPPVVPATAAPPMSDPVAIAAPPQAPAAPVAAPTPIPKPTTKAPREGTPSARPARPAVGNSPPSARSTTTVAAMKESTGETPSRIAPSYSERSRPPRCGELVLKASLEYLTPDELSFLKSRCR